MKRILLLFLIFLTPLIGAAEPDNIPIPTELTHELELAEKHGDTKFYEKFSQMLVTLAAVICFIFFFLWVLKRVLNVRVDKITQTGAIKVLEKKMLSPKTFVYILDFSGKIFAVTESINGVTLLGEVAVNPKKNE